MSLPDHAHTVPSFAVVLSGSIRETVVRETADQAMGAAVLKPAEVIHCNQLGPQGALVLSIKSTSDSQLFAPARWRWIASSAVARKGFDLAVTILADGDAFGTAQEKAWSLIGAATDVQEVSSNSAGWLTRIRDKAASIAKPSVAELAVDAGVHPIYLARAFRRRYGCSVSAFVRTLRVQRSADLLLAPDVSIAEVAATQGFADQSHFCRIFRRELGIPPSVYRSIVLGRAR